MPRPRHAAALSYDEERAAPRRSSPPAAASWPSASSRSRASTACPIHDDAGLAEALARLQLEAEVPEELWKAVAEALVWAYKLTARAA